jgi:hypothetical protein
MLDYIKPQKFKEINFSDAEDDVFVEKNPILKDKNGIARIDTLMDMK